MAIFATKELRRYVVGKNLKEATITVNPVVADEFNRNNREALKQLEHKVRIRVNINSNPSLKIEDVTIQ